uniref:CTP synthase (glutamine hydrolyzing) n=1 Tax=Panagrolaimus davidi TaxID=227884 RepID=A0A914QIT4_9BILA
MKQIPGGFGARGIEGKIKACKYARENNKPFLGICLGMQCAATEFARNVCKIDGATSTEFWEEQNSDNLEGTPPAKELTPEQKIVITMLEHSGGDMGGTMRLGRRATEFLTTDCILYDLYGKNQSIEERHRHRYEINPAVVPKLTAAGLRFVGMGVDQTKNNGNISVSSIALLKIAREAIKDGEQGFINKVKKLCERGEETNTAVRMEMVELKDHPYFVGVQYHPEYTSHPLSPSPPFLGLILASSGQLQSFLDKTRVPSPVNLFHDVESTTKPTKFHYLPSAGNSSASLLTLNDNSKHHSSGADLKVPGLRQQPSPPGSENKPPVFTITEDHS